MIARHHSKVHWTLGILRDLQAFFWLCVFPFPSFVLPAQHSTSDLHKLSAPI